MKPTFNPSQDPLASGSEQARHPHRDDTLQQVWQRLSPRLARSAERTRRHVTARAADMPFESAPAGVQLRTAYDAGDTTELAGAPMRIRLLDLPPGGDIEIAVHAEADTAWLVIDGQAEIGGVSCAAHDYQQRPAGEDSVRLASQNGARLMVREARPSPAEPGRLSAVQTTRAGQMNWEVLADGVSRLLLAPPQGSAAAYLVRMAAGAAAPAHRHGRAEECLLLDGEMYLDDSLLFGGDFQLAHAGGEHIEASSESGVLLLVHGDLDLDVIEAASA